VALRVQIEETSTARSGAQSSPIVWYSWRQSIESPSRCHSALNERSSSRVTRSHASMKFGRETWRGGSLRRAAFASSSTRFGSYGALGSQRMWK
jgi:hypothetical protein